MVDPAATFFRVHVGCMKKQKTENQKPKTKNKKQKIDPVWIHAKHIHKF
jgi:hypothetical protein